MKQDVTLSQLCAAAFAAALALGSRCAGLDPVWVGAAGCAGAVYTIVIWRQLERLPEDRPGLGKAAAPVWFLLLCWAAGESGESFPEGQGFPLIPVTLLALSGWAVKKKAAAVRTACVLTVFLAVIYAVALGFGSAGISLQSFQSRGDWRDGVRALPCWLLPATAILQVKSGGTRQAAVGKWSLAAAGSVTAMAAVSVGVLGPVLARSAQAPFYEMVRGIQALGVMERFEAVVCAAETGAWFVTMCLLAMGVSASLETEAAGSRACLAAIPAALLLRRRVGWQAVSALTVLLAAALGIRIGTFAKKHKKGD